MFSSPVSMAFCHSVLPSRSMRTSPVTALKSAPTTNSGPMLQARSFEPSEIEIVAPLEFVVGELIAGGHADAVWRAIVRQ